MHFTPKRKVLFSGFHCSCFCLFLVLPYYEKMLAVLFPIFEGYWDGLCSLVHGWFLWTLYGYVQRKHILYLESSKMSVRSSSLITLLGLPFMLASSFNLLDISSDTGFQTRHTLSLSSLLIWHLHSLLFSQFLPCIITVYLLVNTFKVLENREHVLYIVVSSGPASTWHIEDPQNHLWNEWMSISTAFPPLEFLLEKKTRERELDTGKKILRIDWRCLASR